jgi:hypothetical protein
LDTHRDDRSLQHITTRKGVKSLDPLSGTKDEVDSKWGPAYLPPPPSPLGLLVANESGGERTKLQWRRRWLLEETENLASLLPLLAVEFLSHAISGIVRI